MPKHRKNNQNKKKDNKKQKTPNQPRPKADPSNADPMGTPNEFPANFPNDDIEDIDDEVSAAVAAYLSGLDETEQAAVAAEVRRLLDALGDNFEIIAQEDDDDDLDIVSPGLRPKLTIEQLLQRLQNENEEIEVLDLYGFSDLTARDADVLRQQWEMISVERRRLIVEELVGLAQEDIDVALGRFLRVAMRDGDAEVRRFALTGLWDEVAVDLLGPFVQLLQSDPDEGVRAAAATGLGGYILAGELDELDSALAMRAEEALLAILGNDQESMEVRRRALESIAYSGEAGVRQLIEDGYYSSNELMRVSAVFAMGRSADVRWRGMVRAELQSPSAEMRAEAAISCGELGSKSAAEDVSALLQDQDERVRLAAIVSLGRIGGPVAQVALETMLLSESPIEQEAADAALEELEYFDQLDAISLFDELEVEDEEEWEDSNDDEWYDEISEDDDLGEYEDDDSDDIAANTRQK